MLYRPKTSVWVGHNAAGGEGIDPTFAIVKYEAQEQLQIAADEQYKGCLPVALFEGFLAHETNHGLHHYHKGKKEYKITKQAMEI